MKRFNTFTHRIRMIGRLVSVRSPSHYASMLAASAALAAISGLTVVLFLGELNTVLLGDKQAKVGDLTWAVMLLAMTSLASYSAQRCIARTAAEFSHDMRVTLTKLVGNAPLERIDQIGMHKIMTVLIDDVGYFVSAMGYLRSLPPTLFIIPGCIAYLLFLDVAIGLAVLIGIPVLLVVGRSATLHATDVMMMGRRADEQIRAQVTQLVAGAKEVKLNLTRRNRLIQRDLFATSRRGANHYIHCMHLYRGFDELVRVFYFGFILSAVAYGIANPDFGLVGSGAVIILLIYLQGHIQAINFGWEQVLPAWMSLGKLSDLHEYLEGNQETTIDRTDELPDWTEIRLENATFRYPTVDAVGQQFVLGPINLSVVRGELIFVTGMNGSGKTTLSKLLSGLYRLTEGAIRLDDRPVGDNDLGNYREMFTILFADKCLFDDLIPSQGVTEEQVAAMLVATNLEGKVAVSDWRFDTLDLSTGQRDRLALIDAMVQRKPIAIFDEWAANQDPAFRRRFYHEYLADFKHAGQTVVVVSHDDRYYHLADKLWNLQDGVLTETTLADGGST